RARRSHAGRPAPERAYTVCRERSRCPACAVPGHCGSSGHPVSVLAHSTSAAWMVLAGRQAAPSREHLIVLPDAPPEGALTERVRRELDQIHRRRGRAPSFAWERMTVRKWTRALEASTRADTGGLAPRPPSPRLRARARHAPPARDNVLYAACTGRAIPK